MNQPKPVVAAFDFDGTITRRDTLIPFLLYVSGKAGFLTKMIRSAPMLMAYGVGLIPNNAAKERLLINFLAGRSLQTLQALGDSFAEQLLPRLIRKQALDRLRWHQSQGHRCVIISASLDVYLAPWARSNGIGDVLCTSLEVEDSGAVTGRLASVNCYGDEKRRRLDELLGDRSKYRVYAYGDSRGDRELLENADVSFYRSIPVSDSTTQEN